jgi:hypothetical protein
MPSHTKRGVSIWAILLAAVGFGLLITKEGGTILFGDAVALTFVAFGAHILFSSAYEQCTVIAMSLRSLVWSAIAGLAYRKLLRNSV